MKIRQRYKKFLNKAYKQHAQSIKFFKSKDYHNAYRDGMWTIRGEERDRLYSEVFDGAITYDEID